MRRSAVCSVVLALLCLCLASSCGLAADSWALIQQQFPSVLTWDATGDASVEASNDGTTPWDSDFALMAVAGVTEPPIPVDRWGLTLVPEEGVTPPVAPGGARRFDFSLVAPPITTLVYAAPVTPTAPGVVSSLECDWVLAKAGQSITTDLAHNEVVISRFPDTQPETDGGWARYYIEECAGRIPFIVAGYQDGLYHPAGIVGRDQMAVFVARAAAYDLPPVATDLFTDVPTGHWAAREIAACLENGVVQGYPDGSYRPQERVSRAQMAVYTARARRYQLLEPAQDPFTDVAVSHWAAREIAACVENGVVQGYPDGGYRPEEVVTRAQMAVYVWRAFIRSEGSPVVLAGPALTSVNPDSAGYYGWSSESEADLLLPGYAYVAFDAVRLDSDLASGDNGLWDVRFELFDAVTPSGAPAASTTLSLSADDVTAAKDAALASGVPYLVLSWPLPVGMEVGEYRLVVSVEDAAGEMRQVARQPTLSIVPGRVLVLYDGVGEHAWLGKLYALQLTNLLGHFPVSPELKPVEEYRPGEVDDCGVTFYLGTTFDNTLPQAFLDDVMATDRTVCWLSYNLWQLAWVAPEFEGRFGFRFEGMFDKSYTTVVYDGETLTRNPAEPDLGVVTVLDPELCVAPAVACVSEPRKGECVPYIVRGRNLWYVGDIPFSYADEENRYLAFADLLHPILGLHHPVSHRAIIRIEDVDPVSSPWQLRAIADYLASQGVPFAVGVIPVHYDPLGVYNYGVPSRVTMSDNPEFVAALHYMVERGGRIVLHGYTHQYDLTLNPFTAASRDDYEFYRVGLDASWNPVFLGPVPEDSEEWVQDRIARALAETRANGLEPVAWHTPHYTASPLDYQVFAANFPITMQRVFYSIIEEPQGQLHYLDQFFPYVVEQDVYGQRIIPENIGHVDPTGTPPYGARLPEDVIRAARKNLVVRDGWANGYFHSVLDLSLLQELIPAIKALGYTYVPLDPSIR